MVNVKLKYQFVISKMSETDQHVKDLRMLVNPGLSYDDINFLGFNEAKELIEGSKITISEDRYKYLKRLLDGTNYEVIKK